ATISSAVSMIPEMKLSQAIEEIMILVRSVNKYLEVTAPWKLAKDIENVETKATLSTVLNTAGEAIRVALTLLHPVISRKADDGLAMLGTSFNGQESLKWGIIEGGEAIALKDALFPRIEVEKPKPQPKKEEVHPLSKFDLKVVEILNVTDHPEADSLYVCTINTGDEERTVCAGIKKRYEKEELVGKKAVLFANLKPAKIRGIESKGMMLAGDKDPDSVELVDPGTAAVGSSVQFGSIPVVPKSKMKIKEFEKITLEVKNGTVVYGEEILNIAGTPITCNTTDGSIVK
ncbi:MAG: methionine--tRNA ligase, partial [Fibrobacterales bacterium]